MTFKSYRSKWCMRAGDMVKSTCSFLNTSWQTKSRKLVIVSVIKPFSKDIYNLVFNVKTVYVVELASVMWECGTKRINSIFFTVVPCFLILSKFLHQLVHKFFKRSIKIYIKTAPTCFGVITIIRERTIWPC